MTKFCIFNDLSCGNDR